MRSVAPFRNRYLSKGSGSGCRRQDFPKVDRKLHEQAGQHNDGGTDMLGDDSASVWYRRVLDVDALPRQSVPTPHTAIGSPDGPLRLFLHYNGWQQLQALFPLEADQKDEERAGILIGKVFADEDGPFIVIDGALLAPHTRLTPGGTTFTSRSWDQLHEMCKRRFPDRLVVGSFRIRHDDNTNLTEYDRYVIKRFFPEWWQVTYVLAPAVNRQALFHWQQGQLKPLSGFWVAGIKEQSPQTETGPSIPEVSETVVSSPVVADEEKEVAEPPDNKLHTFTLISLMIALFVIAFVEPMPGSLPSFQKQIRKENAVRQQLIGEAEALYQLNERLAALIVDYERQNAVSSAGMHPIAAARAATLTAGTNSLLQRLSTSAADGESDFTSYYVIQPGDTLWSISGRFLGDPSAYEKLATENRITDPHFILPGWEIQLRQEGD